MFSRPMATYRKFTKTFWGQYLDNLFWIFIIAPLSFFCIGFIYAIFASFISSDVHPQSYIAAITAVGFFANIWYLVTVTEPLNKVTPNLPVNFNVIRGSYANWVKGPFSIVRLALVLIWPYLAGLFVGGIIAFLVYGLILIWPVDMLEGQIERHENLLFYGVLMAPLGIFYHNIRVWREGANFPFSGLEEPE